MELAIQRLMDFIDASPSPFQAVDNLVGMLDAIGAQALDEGQVWQLEPGAVYYVCRGDSSLIAFRMGLKAPAEAGFLLAGAHTDSPTLKIRPEKELQSKGYMLLALESYGAPILSGWLDSRSGLQGRRGPSKESIDSRFYISHEPCAVIPNLAIHLNRDINKGFEYNLHQHMPALFGLVRSKGEATSASSSETSEVLFRIATELGIEPGAIVSADLRLFDPEPSRLSMGLSSMRRASMTLRAVPQLWRPLSKWELRPRRRSRASSMQKRSAR